MKAIAIACYPIAAALCVLPAAPATILSVSSGTLVTNFDPVNPTFAFDVSGSGFTFAGRGAWMAPDINTSSSGGNLSMFGSSGPYSGTLTLGSSAFGTGIYPTSYMELRSGSVSAGSAESIAFTLQTTFDIRDRVVWSSQPPPVVLSDVRMSGHGTASVEWFGAGQYRSATYSFVANPEPATYILIGIGGLCMVIFRLLRVPVQI